jgi:hypothetical protein
MKNEGPNNILFDDGQLITYQYPVNRLGGMIFGDRILNIEGAMTFIDKVNLLKAVIFFKHKDFDSIYGKLYTINLKTPQSKKEPTCVKEIKDI